MKKIAILLLLVFGLVQVAPAVVSLFDPHTPVFIVDEEKGEDKTEADKKEKKKDYSAFAPLSQLFGNRSCIAFQLAEKISLAPYLETLSPPPNC